MSTSPYYTYTLTPLNPPALDSNLLTLDRGDGANVIPLVLPNIHPRYRLLSTPSGATRT